jgi:hypothetical protein
MKNLGTKVSRVLENQDTNYTSVVFQPLRPPLDSEWNLVQNIQSLALQGIITSIKMSGFLKLAPIETRPSNGNSMWKNVLKFKNPSAIVNGHLFHIGGGTNQFQTGALDSIWKNLSNDENEVVVILPEAPATGSRDDVVWLEIWEQLVGTQDQINKYGFQQYAGTPLQNDLVDPNVSRETSVRTQWKYRIRTNEGVDLITFREGLGHPSVFAQGGKVSPVSGYTFTKSELGHWVAGDGSSTAATALKTVDGFVYAMPICSVHRKNKSVYSTVNPNGASKTIDTGVSDRPDGRFGDEIAPEDIEDLRHLVDLGDDLRQLTLGSLDKILNGEQDRFILGDVPDLFSAVNTQLDGIAVSDRANTSESLLRRPNGFQRTWSDSEVTERHTYFVAAGSLNPFGRFEVAPPQFFSAFDTDKYRDYNPFIGAVLVPKIINAVTGAVIVPDATVGNHGWENLGDRLNKGTVTFKPNIAGDILGKKILVEYDLVIPSGTGLSRLARTFYGIHDDFNNEDVIATEGASIDKTLTRNINGFVDSQTITPVSKFITPTNQNEAYRAGVIERVYHVFGNGTSSITIPATIDGRSVLNIIRVQVASNDGDIPLGGGSNPKFTAKSDGSFVVHFQSLFPQITDTIKVTVVLGGKAVEFNRKNKSIENFTRTTYIQFQSTGAGQYRINTTDSITNSMEIVYALAGYFNGTGWKQICYVGATNVSDADYVEITSLTGLGTGQLVINFSVPPTSGKWIKIPLIGTYSPTTQDEYTVTYDYVPYQGISSIIATGETLEADVLYIHDKALVTTNGTAGEELLSDGKEGITTRLPINLQDADFSFSNENLTTHGSRSVSSTRYVPYDYHSVPNTQTGYIKIGDTLTLTKVDLGQPNATARGVALTSPEISYMVDDLDLEREEDLSVQCDGTNRVFNLQSPVLSKFGTFAVAQTFTQTGLIVLTSGSQTVNGLTTLFTRQVKAGVLIRPIGATTWNQVKEVVSDSQMTLYAPFASSSFTGSWEIYMPDMEIFLNGVLQDPNVTQQVCGKDGIVVFAAAPAASDRLVIKYRTGVNTLNCIFGLAVGKGVLEGELLLFTLTTSSNSEFVAAPEFNALKEGKANRLIFNNTTEVDATQGLKNEGNRVVIAADLFFPRVRRLKMNQKVTS